MESKEERIRQLMEEIERLKQLGQLYQAIIKTIEVQCIETEEEE